MPDIPEGGQNSADSEVREGLGCFVAAELRSAAPTRAHAHFPPYRAPVCCVTPESVRRPAGARDGLSRYVRAFATGCPLSP